MPRKKDDLVGAAASAAAAAQAGQEAIARRELAAVFRLLAHFDMADLIFTHATARLPWGEGRMLINPYGLMFDEITASNLVSVDWRTPRVYPARQVNPTGLVIHGAIHQARPDAACVVHAHSLAGCAIAARKEGLLPLNQISLEFYDRVAYHDYEGVSLNEAEKDRLIANLGSLPVMIMRNHGLLAVGKTPAQAFLRIYYLEKACRIQVAAQSGGSEIIIPDPRICERAALQLVGESVGDDFVDDVAYELAWRALLRLLDRTAPDYVE